MSDTGESRLFVLGTSHRLAPLEVRERMALDPARVEALYERVYAERLLDECLVLSTCNRLEIYGLASDHDVREQLRGILCGLRQLPEALFEAHTLWQNNYRVVEHLFAVAAGLDSQMLGETEIFGQLKAGYRLAQQRKMCGPVLNKVLQKAFQTAKWVRTHTGINRGQISIGNVAVDLAQRIFGPLSDCRVLVLGAGEVAAKTVQSLVSRGARRITLTARRPERSQALAAEVGGETMPWEAMPQALARADIVVASTGATDPVISRDRVEEALSGRPDDPLFFIDVAMPRDVDPEVALLENAFAYNLDDLAEIANHNLEARQLEIERCRDIVRRRAWQCWLGLVRRPLDPWAREPESASSPIP